MVLNLHFDSTAAAFSHTRETNSVKITGCHMYVASRCTKKKGYLCVYESDVANVILNFELRDSKKKTSGHRLRVANCERGKLVTGSGDFNNGGEHSLFSQRSSAMMFFFESHNSGGFYKSPLHTSTLFFF